MQWLDLSAARSIFADRLNPSSVADPIPKTLDISEIYAAHASGTLDPALSLLLGTQRILTGEADKALFLSEALSGALLERETPVELSANALANTFAAIDALETGNTVINSPVKLASSALDEILALPDPLRGLAIEAAGDKGWQKTAPGIQRLVLDAGSHAETELYRIEGGRAVPRHSHHGSEFTLVVSGGFAKCVSRLQCVMAG